MRPHGNHASVSTTNPEALAVCDRCGRWWNRGKLAWQTGWAGQHLYNFQLLVCPLCYDTPNEQLRTIILPPDPPPIINARVPDFEYEEYIPLAANTGGNTATPPWGYGPELLLCDQSGEVLLIAQYTQSLQTGTNPAVSINNVPVPTVP